MAGRKLSRRQAWRIQKIQEERLARARRKADRVLESEEAGLGPEEKGLVIANYGATLDVEAGNGEISRCAVRQNIDTLVVGDQVVWQAGSKGNGVVVALQPRRSLLARPDSSGRMRPLAANIDQILIVTAPRPAYETYLIDQYLAAAETIGIAPILVLNKIDLLEGEEKTRVERDLDIYREIGYPVIHASTVEKHGLDELIGALQGKISVFVGQSGVGKSSLVKVLLPETEIAVGELSESTGLGRHTTSAARLYHLPTGGSIIDSPGVREFRLWQLSRDQLAQGFRDFRPYLGHCRFRDCSHRHEPGCALLDAVESGRLSRQRIENFQRIADTLSNIATTD